MRGETISCDSLRSNGGSCGAPALIHQVHYRYEAGPDWMPDVERILTEIHYDISCPRCGYRTQVEPVALPEDALKH
jgi:hypothetical protein